MNNKTNTCTLPMAPRSDEGHLEADNRKETPTDNDSTEHHRNTGGGGGGGGGESTSTNSTPNSGRTSTNNEQSQEEISVKHKILRFICTSFKTLLFFTLSSLLTVPVALSIYFGSNRFHNRGGLCGLGVLTVAIVSTFFVLLQVLHLYWVYRRSSMVKKTDDDDSSPETDEDVEIPALMTTTQGDNNNDNDVEPGNNKKEYHSFKAFLFDDRISCIRRFFLRYLVPFAVLQLVALQLSLLFVAPYASLFPVRPPYSEYALVEGGSEYAGYWCDDKPEDIAQMYQEAKDFFQNNTVLDLSDIPLIYIPREKENVAAYVVDEAIYLPRGSCPYGTSLLVHEIVHIYQVQVGYFSFRWLVEYIRNSLQCFSCLYDYGGYQGLQSMMEMAIAGNNTTAANIFTAFGSEQMAEIVEDYYIEFDTCHSHYRPDYCDALEFYANQILIA